MHPLTDFRDSGIFLFQILFLHSGEIAIKPVFDGNLSAVEMILLIAVKAEAVFKITAPLAVLQKRDRAGRSVGVPRRCCTTHPSGNTGIVRPRGFQYEDGKAIVGQRRRLTVLGQHLIYSVDVGLTTAQILCKPIASRLSTITASLI